MTETAARRVVLGVSTVAYDGHPMDRALASLARLGVRRVEPAFIDGYARFDEGSFVGPHARNLAAILKAEGLAVAALSAHIDLGQGGAHDRLMRRLDLAVRIGAPFLVTNTSQRAFEGAVLTLLETALPQFAQAKVMLAVENPGHGTDNLIANGAAGAAFVRRVGHPSLGLNYDLGNALTYGERRGDAADDLRDALPAVVHLHVKDVLAKGDDWHFAVPGEGCCDIPAALATLPPHLPIGIELPLRLWRPGRGDPVRRDVPPEMAEIETMVARSVAAVARMTAGT